MFQIQLFQTHESSISSVFFIVWVVKSQFDFPVTETDATNAMLLAIANLTTGETIAAFVRDMPNTTIFLSKISPSNTNISNGTYNSTTTSVDSLYVLGLPKGRFVVYWKFLDTTLDLYYQVFNNDFTLYSSRVVIANNVAEVVPKMINYQGNTGCVWLSAGHFCKTMELNMLAFTTLH